MTLLQKFKARHPHIPTKSGVMLGLGETMEQVQATLRDLRAHDVEMVTIGQYRQPAAPTHRCLRTWPRTQFKPLAFSAICMGFPHVPSGPRVRSSSPPHRPPPEPAAAPCTRLSGSRPTHAFLFPN